MFIKCLLVLIMALPLMMVSQSAQAMSNDTFEKRTQVLINKHRSPDVSRGACLDRYAERWARRLKRSGEFENRKPSTVKKGCDLKFSGEILARGYASPRKTVRAWLRSPSHRAILENFHYRKIGIGAVRVYGGWIVVVNFGAH